MDGSWGWPARHLAPPDAIVLSEREASLLAASHLGEELPVACIQRRHRNEVFSVGDHHVLKVYTRHGHEKVARKREAHRMLGSLHGWVPVLLTDGHIGPDVTWTLESRVATSTVGHEHLDQFGRHRSMGQRLRELHKLSPPHEVAGGWRASEDLATYAARSLFNATSRSTGAAERADRELGRRASDALALRLTDLFEGGDIPAPTFLHGGYTGANCACVPNQNGWSVEAVFDFEDSHPGDPAEDVALIAIYGSASDQYRGLMAGYQPRGSLKLFSERATFWTGVTAVGVLEWGTRLGDIGYTTLARRYLRSEVLRDDE